MHSAISIRAASLFPYVTYLFGCNVLCASIIIIIIINTVALTWAE